MKRLAMLVIGGALVVATVVGMTAKAAASTQPLHDPNPVEHACRCDNITAAPASGVAPLTVKFTMTELHVGHDMTGITVEHKWNFGDGQTASTAKPTVTHTYAKAGTYTVTGNIIGHKPDGTIQIGKKPCTTKVVVKAPGEVLGSSTKTPSQLPNTGAGDALVGMSASGGLALGVRHYLKSRKQLAKSLLAA